MESGTNQTQSDQKGELSLPCLEPGANGIYISKENDYYPNTLLSIFRGDWKNSIVHISAGETRNDFEIRLPPKGARLTGRVVDAVSGKIIESAILILCRAKTRVAIRLTLITP